MPRETPAVINGRSSGMATRRGGWCRYASCRPFERIRTDWLYRDFMSGSSVESLARAFRLELSEVEAILRWYLTNRDVADAVIGRGA